MHIVFADTGVQCVCEPLSSIRGASASTIGLGWQRCRRNNSSGETEELNYVQWKIISGKLFLAIDTTCGNPADGFFCSAEALAGDFPIVLEDLLGADGQLLPNFHRVDVVIRPATAGAGTAKHVHMVVDFGNSRTGALLIEPDREAAGTPLMEPFELVNRHHMDAWDENGEFQKKHSARWFNSRTQWCISPYLPPPRIERKIYSQGNGNRSGWFPKPKPTSHTVFVIPRMFQDLSAVRMGQEADEVIQSMRTDWSVLTGLSSPKRYLWADDESWLQDATWHMADPDDRCATQNYSTTLQGPLMRYLTEDDSDELDLPMRDQDEISEEELSREVPLRPQHAPRTLMVAALYELFCQAYTYVNSHAYRYTVGDAGQPRELRNFTLTYPTGMIAEERERYRRQAQKAIDIFYATLGRRQESAPTLTMNIDEASATHLTYIWSELQKVNYDPRLWFSLLGRKRIKISEDTSSSEQDTNDSDTENASESPRRRRRRTNRSSEEVASAHPEVRIACLDIGGGTSDLMIAKYELNSGAVDTITGRILHKDGISVAGDHLVKRLLERIIIPEFADCVSMEPQDVDRLFGEERGWNRHFKPQRILWINRLFVPLAEAYLKLAVEGNENESISHINPDFVDPDIVQSLQDTIDDEFKGGNINVTQDLDLYYDEPYFKEVVHEVFNELLLDFCGRIAKHDVDVVLLAGQPTKLGYIQELVKKYLPLPSTRVIPMFEHYAGPWYPYQDEEGLNPGVIVDPKSAVVVGAAVESLITKGKLGAMRFRMKPQEQSSKSKPNHFFWGIMEERLSRIHNYKVLFRPDDSTSRVEFEVASERVIIGRRLSSAEDAEVSPVWLLKVDKKDDSDLPIDLHVTLLRKQASEDQEETLELVSVKGDVAGEPAECEGPYANVSFTWRTLADERYYLDTGALDNIDIDGR